MILHQGRTTFIIGCRKISEVMHVTGMGKMKHLFFVFGLTLAVSSGQFVNIHAQETLTVDVYKSPT